MLFKKAYLFICTSEIEGYPNTFLQAWMNECPIVSTFDPSDLIKNRQLGVYCETYEDVRNGFDKLLSKDFYKLVQTNIKSYYKNNSSAQVYYERLLNKFLSK